MVDPGHDARPIRTKSVGGTGTVASTTTARSVAVAVVIVILLLTATGCSDPTSGQDLDRDQVTTARLDDTAIGGPGLDDDSDTENAADAIALEVTGQPVEIPQHFFGLNAASIVSPVNVEAMLDPDLWDHLRTFPMPLIRIPSGTAAQWIDWRTGRFIDGAGSPFAEVPTTRRGITIDDWARLVDATGAEPVWDLNVVNSTLDDQIQMLVEAERSGMPVRLIELGNEPWDIRGPYLDRYPTGAEYATEMNRWIPVIRQHFPDARIAVAGSDRADGTFMEILGERYADWNSDVLSTIRGIDAMVIHQYWGLPDGAAPGSDVGRTLAAGLDHWAEMRRLTFDVLDRNDGDGNDGDGNDDPSKADDGPLEIWITEWNQAAHFAPPGTQTWAQALSVVMVAMEHALDPRVGMSLVHNIVDGVGNPHDIGPSMVYPSFTNGQDGTERYGRTALGTALPLLFGAASGNTEAQRLAAASPDTSQVHGIVFAGDRTDVVLVNAGDSPATITLPRTIVTGLGSDATSIEYHTDADAAIGWEPGTRYSTDIGRLDDPGVPRVLPAFSITRIISADE